MSDQLPTDILVTAQIRIAANNGIPIFVRHRGDNNSGTIVLKINKLDGSARVLTQVMQDEKLVWAPVSKKDPMPDEDAENYLKQRVDFDPDVWLLEVEDKEGRHWFPGKVITY